MKKLALLILSTLNTGCISTSPTTGRVRVAGIPIPFTGTGDSTEITDPVIAMIEQLAFFQWAALILIIGGAFLWYWTKGSTGFGKFMIGLGVSLSVFALVMPQIAGWIGLIAILGVLGLVGYFICKFIKGQSNV